MSVREEILALENLGTAELAAEFERLHGKPPRYRNPTWMRKRIAFQLQVAAYGGLPSVARAAIERINADLQLPPAAPPRGKPDNNERDKGRLRPGTVLTRTWHGREIRAELTTTGFIHDGQEFRSLSAVAKHVTGQHWNGRLFFKLASRKPKK